ncbi:uncharacterized protein LOC105437551 [Strongylocentrotus purpuratus]|uniref:CCHC-type domain-containing protein n=1 Tax=Strongylocentrotus purpuratus TaxID=7668 RepID=A0A7M7N8X6_STRPU|nr:uncharacterized protein LOC105437551 [Strongylocentrotus purpuratus]
MELYVDDCVNEARDERAETRASASEARRLESELVALQIKLAELRSDAGNTSQSVPKVRIPPIPPSQDGKDDIDSYLCRFERHAVSVDWNTDVWALVVSALLTGKALQIISRLTVDEAKNYNAVMTALLKGYDLMEEGCRLKFRHAKIQSGETYIQFASRIEKYFDRWLELSPYDSSIDGMKSLTLQEQVLDTGNRELLMFIKERQPSSLQNLLILADQYRDAHSDPRTHRIRDRPSTETQQSEGSGSKSHGRESQSLGGKTMPRSSQREERTCHVCKKVGHLSWNCPQRKRPEKGASMSVGGPSSEPAVTGTGNVESGSTSLNGRSFAENHEGICIIDFKSPVIERNLTEDGMGVKLAGGEIFPLLSAAACGIQEDDLKVCKGLVNGALVDMLRDTGCSTVVVRRDLIHHTTQAKWRPCVMNPLYDLVFGQVSGVRKSDDPDPDWTPRYHRANAVETREQKRQAARTRPPLHVPKPFDDAVVVEDLIKVQAEDESLSTARKFADTGEKKISRQGNCFLEVCGPI